MRQIANNTFNGGINMDLNPLTTPNTVLTDALNGTIVTYDGNEFVLQADDGNSVISGCTLDRDFIPLGIKEYGGIIYIVSKNPFTNECEIGSFPSPEKFILYNEGEDESKTTINNSLIHENSTEEEQKGLKNFAYQLDFGNIKKLLRPGDKFCIYSQLSTTESGHEISPNFNLTDLIEKYEDGKLEERNLFKLKLIRITDSGETEDISELVPDFKTKGIFWTDENKFKDLLDYNLVQAYFTTYINKLNGYLALSFETEQIDEFNIGLNVIKTSENKFDLQINLQSIVDKKCKNNIAQFDLKLIKNNNEDSPTLDKTININNENDEYNKNNYSEGNELKSSYPGGSNISVPNQNISYEYKCSDLDTDEDYTITITPASKFNKFNNLIYTNSFNFSKLSTLKSSEIWKYYLEKSIDTDIELDKIKISFDFIIKGTLNGRNKLDALYLQFYDVAEDVSTIYPINSILDSKTITINLNPELNNETTEDYYYLLVDKSKQFEYNKYLSEKSLDDPNEKNDTLKIKCYHKVEDVILGKNKFVSPTNINNIRLTYNRFYVVAIVGLDYYESLGDYNVKKYITYNYLWTNGVFNKYWLENSDVKNFNTLQYPDFIVPNLTKSDFINNIKPSNLSTNIEDLNSQDKSYQNYTNLYTTIKDSTFNTRLNVNGEISKKYSYSLNTNPTYIPNYMSLNAKISDVLITPYKEDFNKFTENQYTINEDGDNYSSIENMKTNTTTNGYRIYSYDTNKTNKVSVSKTTLDDINIDINIISNRKVLSKSRDSEKQAYNKVYTKLGTYYGKTASLIDTNRYVCWAVDSRVGPLDNDAETASLNIIINDSNNYTNDWYEALSTDLVQSVRNESIAFSSNSNLILNRINSFSINTAIPFKVMYGKGKGTDPTGLISVTGNYVNANYIKNNKLVKNINNIDYDKQIKNNLHTCYSILIPDKERSIGKVLLIPAFYIANDSTAFKDNLKNINQSLNDRLTIEKLELNNNLKYYISDISSIQYHNDFNSNFTFNFSIGKIVYSYIDLYIDNKKTKTLTSKLDDIYNYIDTYIIKSKDKILDNSLFSTNTYKNSGIPYIETSTPINLQVKDDFTLDSNSFYIIKNNNNMFINNIVYELTTAINTIPSEEYVIDPKVLFVNSEDSGFRYNNDTNSFYYIGSDASISGIIPVDSNPLNVRINRLVSIACGAEPHENRGIYNDIELVNSNATSIFRNNGVLNNFLFNTTYSYPIQNK